MNGGSGRPDGKESYSDAEFAQFAKVGNAVADIAAGKGIPTVMHPHFGCMIETTADVDALVAGGLDKEKIGLCVHAGHQFAKGVDPYEMYEKHAGWIRYLHIGDNTAEKDGEFVGEGVLDQERLMNAPLKEGFDGWVVIECKKDGVDPTEYAAKTREYLTKTWPDLAWD